MIVMYSVSTCNSQLLAPWYRKYATTTCGENHHKIYATKNCGKKLATCGRKVLPHVVKNTTIIRPQIFQSLKSWCSLVLLAFN